MPRDRNSSRAERRCLIERVNNDCVKLPLPGVVHQFIEFPFVNPWHPTGPHQRIHGRGQILCGYLEDQIQLLDRR
jgi:hypothetical protein